MLKAFDMKLLNKLLNSYLNESKDVKDKLID